MFNPKPGEVVMAEALLQAALEWRKTALLLDFPPDNVWIESLVFMDDEALVNEYRSFAKVFGKSLPASPKLPVTSD